MAIPFEIPFHLLRWSDKLLVYEVPCDSDDPLEFLATLVEKWVGYSILMAAFIKGYSEALEAARERGEPLPVSDERLDRVLEQVERLRRILLCTSVAALDLLEEYPEVAGALPSLDDQLEAAEDGDPDPAGPRYPEGA